ncbi:MAG: hypothetical protein EP346_08560 [Bacteroidetes bacterium]|uniref:ABC transporter permease n=1 Tax=Phaeocystidibacter marisrubri TaxID=1577780 RepID=A0A6L3ZJK5_9FLAO|nr:heme exporter protein CcmB [Phaeocystidibacter marisrubri]KAB2818172.1 hypothetical protein F8C82_07155 [Phaeocystidibacter marisrubri]TNE28612.1 MAG: hypothetical protein EP346_08560 [Bacteroidota bacterium]GGH71574.1 hypothetical protein GCM10011318_14670 [Phaeocystidibacter marisrubri]
MWREIRYLIAKDLKLDFRQRYAIFATLLYAVSTTYLSYFIFRETSLNRLSWVALYWIITIFSALSSATRSFSAESQNRFWYYAQLVRPSSMILAKMIYNSILLVIIGVFTYGLFTFLLGNPIIDNLQMLVVVIIGTVGFSTTLTLLSAISAKTNNNTVLIAVLSIPLMLPLTILLVRASHVASLGMNWGENTYLIFLLLFSSLTGILSFILYPQIWRE